MFFIRITDLLTCSFAPSFTYSFIYLYSHLFTYLLIFLTYTFTHLHVLMFRPTEDDFLYARKDLQLNTILHGEKVSASFV